MNMLFQILLAICMLLATGALIILIKNAGIMATILWLGCCGTIGLLTVRLYLEHHSQLVTGTGMVCFLLLMVSSVYASPTQVELYTELD